MTRHERESLLVFAGVLVVAIVFWLQSTNLAYPDSVFPKAVVIGTGGLSMLNIALVLWHWWRRGAPVAEAAKASEAGAEQQPFWRNPILVGVCCTALLYVGILILGFYTGTALFLFGMFGLKERRDGRFTVRQGLISVVGAVGVTALLYIGFTVLLGVQTPTGVFI